MKTIKVFIASSEELKLERLEFVDVIQNLNHALKPRGVEIEPIKWEYLDASMNAERKQTEYNNALRECEMCLVMYWTRFGSYTEEELTTAWESLKKGDNPRKLYVYFKEPSDVTPELQTFKESFVTKYGHFYCKFENVDTMSLNFLLQFEQYQSARHEQDSMVQIKDSKVLCGNIPVANLKNVPFAGNNPDYMKLRESLKKIQEEIVTFESILAAAPNEALEGMLLQKRFDREKLTKELEEMEKSLMDTAKQIVRLSYTASSARLQKAIELFEKGDNKGANAVLDFDEIKAEMAQNASRIDQARELEKAALEALKSNIEECKLKVKTLQTEKEEGWLAKCCEIYEDALRQAEGRMKDEEVAELRFDYALLLHDNRQYEHSAELYGINVALYRELLKSISDSDMLNLAASNIGNLAILHEELHRYEQSEQEFAEAINIHRKLAKESPNLYMEAVAISIGNLANVHRKMYRFKQAEKEFVEAIGIYRELAEESPVVYLEDVARNLGNLAILHDDLHQFEQAEQEYFEAINICQELVKQFPDTYTPSIAINMGNLANLHSSMHKYDQSEQEYREAIDLFRELSEQSPDAFIPDVALNIGNLARLHNIMHQYEHAEQEFAEAIGLYRKLAEQFPDAYMPSVAINIGNLACYHRALHRYEQAEKEFGEAINIFRNLAAKEPEAFLPKVAFWLNEISYLYYNQGDIELALERIEEAIFAAPNEPNCLDSKGEFLLRLGRTDEALSVYHQILEMDADFFKNTESELEKGLKEQGRI